MSHKTPLSTSLLDRLGGFIAGEWVDDAEDEFYVADPSNGQVLAQVPRLGAGEATRAVDAAREAMRDATSLEQRRDWLRRIAAVQREHARELARIITHENGKPLAEAEGEVRYAAGFYEYAAEHIDRLAPHALKERPKDHSWTVHYRSAGVAALITPWNFPLAMLAKKLSAALAGGCAAVVKPAEKTPLSCIALFRLLERLDLPRGQVNLVFGDAPAIGEVLCTHPAVRVLSFTGSTQVGRLLATQAAPHLKRLSLELGGNAPFIVFDDADLDAVVEHFVANKFRASGQTCVCTNRVLVQASVAEDFTARVAARVGELRVGKGTQDGVDLGPLIDGQGWDKVREHLEDALDGGARVVGGQPPNSRPTASEGWFFNPVVLADVPAGALCMREETFGPLVSIATFVEEEEAVRIANDVEAGLAAYVFTADAARGQRVVAGLTFGHVGLNTATGPTPEAPFGGMGVSGYGREGGDEGLFEYVEAQTVPEP